MNHLKLFLIGLFISALVFLIASCSAMPVCTSVVKLKVKVCPVN